MKYEEYRLQRESDPEYTRVREQLRPFLDLAADVVKLRIRKGWSQTKLAQEAHTGQPNISRIEDGLANPTIKFLQKLARALGARLEVRLRKPGDLIARRDEKPWVIAAKMYQMSSDTRTLTSPTALPARAPSVARCWASSMNQDGVNTTSEKAAAQ